MELLAPTVVAPWLGGLVGFTFAASVIAVLLTLSFHAGLYYSLPRMVLKGLSRHALRRL